MQVAKLAGKLKSPLAMARYRAFGKRQPGINTAA